MYLNREDLGLKVQDFGAQVYNNKVHGPLALLLMVKVPKKAWHCNRPVLKYYIDDLWRHDKPFLQVG